MVKYFKAIIKVGFKIIFAYFSYMRKYAKHPERYPLQERWDRYSKLARAVLASFNVELHVQGLSFIQTRQTQFIIGNHLSFMDPVILLAISRKPIIFVAKKESRKFPFVGKTIVGIGGLFLDREALKQEVKIMIEVRRQLTQEARSVAMFPEGTRNTSYNQPIAPFKAGTFKYALQTKTPIVAFAMVGQQFVLDKRVKWKKYPIYVKFAAPELPESAQKDTIKAGEFYHQQVKYLFDEIRPCYETQMKVVVDKKAQRKFLTL